MSSVNSSRESVVRNTIRYIIYRDIRTYMYTIIQYSAVKLYVEETITLFLINIEYVYAE